MSERTVTVASKVGLHARPASLLVQAAAAQPVVVKIAKVGGGDPVDARSILGVLGLDARNGDEVVLTADGDGADAAIAAVATVVETDHDAESSPDGSDSVAGSSPAAPSPQAEG